MLPRTDPLPTSSAKPIAELAPEARDGERRPRWHAPALLTLFSLVYLALALSSVRSKSATLDEPQHLTAGIFAARASDFRIDPEHPPLLRRWAAWTLPADALKTTAAAAVPSDWGAAWLGRDQYSFCHRYLYGEPGAADLLGRARAMNLLWGVLLGLLLFAWARELFGFVPAAAVLTLYLLEPNLLAHARLVTTDLGVTVLLLGAVYFLWRLTIRISWASMVGFAAFAALAAVSKFSAPILGPLAALLIGARVLARRRWGRAATASARAALGAGILLVAGVASWAAIWAAYDFRYVAAPHGAAVVRLDRDPRVYEKLPRVAAAVGWSEERRLLPNAYTQGFLYGRYRGDGRPAYLLGSMSESGFRSYFPVAILAKSPVALLAALAVGIALLAGGRRSSLRTLDRLFLALPIVIYLGAAIASSLNIGLRHVLPIYPFMILVAGVAIAEGLRRRRGVVVELLLALAAVESLAVWPDYLTFFNVLSGGPGRGDAILVDSNLDWGQDLPGLARWMRENGVERINLSYFGSAAPEYYGIDCNYLPGSPFFATERIRAPEVPGYVAVSVTNLRVIRLIGREQLFYAPLLEMEPAATIGGSIRVYWVGSPDEKSPDAGATS